MVVIVIVTESRREKTPAMVIGDAIIFTYPKGQYENPMKAIAHN